MKKNVFMGGHKITMCINFFKDLKDPKYVF